MRHIVLGLACTLMATAATARAQQTVGNYVRPGATPLSQYGPQQPGFIAPAQPPQQPPVSTAPEGVQQAVYQQPVQPAAQPQPPAQPAAQSIYNQSHLQPNMVRPAAHAVPRPGLQYNPTTGRQEIRPAGPLPPSTKPHTNPYFMGRKKRGSFVLPVSGPLPGQSIAYQPQPGGQPMAPPTRRERTWQEDLKKFFWPW